MKLKINATPIFIKNWEALINPEVRYIINQGGSRSGKSFAILHSLIVKACQQKLSISIVRQSFPALRGTIMRDFFEMLKDLNIYNENNHSKTEHIYTFDNGSKIEFFSTDSEQKIRGRKRDILYCNEANELSYDIFLQLRIRTTQKIFIDFNPSDEESFIYPLIEDKKSVLIKSTYLDNPFLSQDHIEEIESLINADPEYYKVYVLGERATKNTRVYTHFKQYVELPECRSITYGLDLGYNDPCVLVKTHWKDDNTIYVEEVIYKSKLTTQDLINLMKELGISKSHIIYCDHRPEVIEEIRRSGYNIKSAKKSINEGINSVKSLQVNIHHESLNILKEYKAYSWKSKGDQILDEVVDINNHSMDAIRYSVHSVNRNQRPITVYTFDF